jgi:hypothetical protein
MKLLTDNINFEMNYKGTPVKIEAAIFRESVAFKFYDKTLAKEAYEFERLNGKTVIKFIKKENVLIEYYPRKNREQVRNIVIEKLKRAGAIQKN